MKIDMKPENQTKSRSLLIAFAAALAVALMAALLQLTQAAVASPPSVPANIQVPAGHKLFLIGHAIGSQNYICLPSGGDVKYVLFTPQATLYNGENQVTTHYFSPNPDEAGTIRATWRHSRDTSTVWGMVQPGNSSTDAAYVEPGAIPWLLLTIVGSENGPTGGDLLANATYVQRLNTSGGVAPATGCSSPNDIGKQAFVPYTTDYYFYRKAA